MNLINNYFSVKDKPNAAICFTPLSKSLDDASLLQFIEVLCYFQR